MWRAKKCNLIVSAKTAPTGTGVAAYHGSKENFRNFWATVCHGTMLAPTETLY